MDAPATATVAPAAAPDLIQRLEALLASLKTSTGIPQLQGIDLTGLTKLLETEIGALPALAAVIPQLGVVVPFVPLAQGALKLVEELQATPHDPKAVADVIIKHLYEVVDKVQTLMGSLRQQAPASPTPTAG